MLAVCQACWHALDDLSVDSVEAGRATVGLESKAKAAQLSVLSKYGVLADFTDVEEVVLDRALKGRLSAIASKDLTFAHWCPLPSPWLNRIDRQAACFTVIAD